jgi:hypothetical protein
MRLVFEDWEPKRDAEMGESPVLEWILWEPESVRDGAAPPEGKGLVQGARLIIDHTVGGDRKADALISRQW